MHTMDAYIRVRLWLWYEFDHMTSAINDAWCDDEWVCILCIKWHEPYFL